MIRPRILLADHDEATLDEIARSLNAEYEVMAVRDGAAALAAARQESFDLVLANFMLPEIGGLALLRALREQEGTRSLPVVLLSAPSGEDACAEAMAGGAVDYVTMPVSGTRCAVTSRPTGTDSSTGDQSMLPVWTK